MNDVTKRFIEVIDSLKISDYALAKEVDGLSTQTLSKIRNDKYNISLTTLALFCEHYPQFNADWIVNGRGGKFIDDLHEYITIKGDAKIGQDLKYKESYILLQQGLLRDKDEQYNTLEIKYRMTMEKLQESVKENESLKAELSKIKEMVKYAQ